MRPILVVATWCLVGLAHASPEDMSAARVHFAAATAYFERGEYEDAAKEFSRAYALSKRPDLLYNIARCQEQLGEWDDALVNVQKFLAERASDEQGKQMQIRLQNRIQRRDSQPKSAPPPPIAQPVPPSATPLAEARRPTPVYKKWWLWTTLGVAAAGVGLGVGLGLGLPGPTAPDSPLGTQPVF